MSDQPLPDAKGGMPTVAGQTTPSSEPDKQAQPLTFDAWLSSQPNDVKDLVEDHAAGLKSALEAERMQRRTLERQLKDAAKSLPKDSDQRAVLEEMSAKLTAASRTADFYDRAHAAGAGNLRLLFIAAQDAGLVDQNGEANFETLKQRFPELFGKRAAAQPPAPAGNAGSGTTNPQKPLDMNARIRQAAGFRN